MYLNTLLPVLGALFTLLPAALAGFDASSAKNVAVYWGQNSHGVATGNAGAQQRLSYYCANSEVNVFVLAFIIDLIDPPYFNLANAQDNCTQTDAGLSCPQLEEDIATCQNTYDKSIIFSIGGATFSGGGLTSEAAAISAANNIWATFGPPSSSFTGFRPFGSSAVDGFDFDLEGSAPNMAAFAIQMRSIMTASTASTGKKYLITSAPQCPYPDAYDQQLLGGPSAANVVAMDAIFVQYYNNYCGVQNFANANAWNWDEWDTWAKTVSINPDVKVLLGVPGSATAAGSGYLSGTALAPIIHSVAETTSFGGLMIWDASQVWANTGFLDQYCNHLVSNNYDVNFNTHNHVNEYGDYTQHRNDNSNVDCSSSNKHETACQPMESVCGAGLEWGHCLCSPLRVHLLQCVVFAMRVNKSTTPAEIAIKTAQMKSRCGANGQSGSAGGTHGKHNAGHGHFGEEGLFYEAARALQWPLLGAFFFLLIRYRDGHGMGGFFSAACIYLVGTG